jgi:hypothetical protein
MSKLVISLLALATISLHAAEPTITLAGIRTVWNDAKKEFDGFKTFNSDKGTAVAVLVSVTEGSIVAFDSDNAKLTIGGKPAKIRFGGDISKDHQHLKLEIETKAPISVADLAILKIEGSLPITTATGSAQIKSDPFEVKPETTVPFTTSKLPTPRSLTVSKSGKPQWGDDPFEISFKSDRKFDEFASISFTSADGQAIESSHGGFSTMSMLGKTTAESSYTFKQQADKLVMVLSAWTGCESKVLKIALTAADAK